jgi:hypothetical protein
VANGRVDNDRWRPQPGDETLRTRFSASGSTINLLLLAISRPPSEGLLVISSFSEGLLVVVVAWGRAAASSSSGGLWVGKYTSNLPLLVMSTAVLTDL